MYFKIQATKKIFIYFISAILVGIIYYLQMNNQINFITYFIALLLIAIVTFVIAGTKEEIVIDRHRLYLTTNKLKDIKISKIKKVSKGSISDGLIKVSGSFSAIVIEKTNGEKAYFPIPLKKDEFIEKLKTENQKIVFEL